MKWLLPPLLLLLASCQVIGTTAHILGASIGCEVNDNPTEHLVPGTLRHFQVSVALNDHGTKHAIEETVACEYQGAMCAGGTWFQVWYGDKDIRQHIVLSDNNQLSLTPNNICTDIHFFEKACAEGTCDASEHFRLKLHFNKDIQQQRQNMPLRWEDGEFVHFENVNGERLRKLGYEVMRFSISNID